MKQFAFFTILFIGLLAYTPPLKAQNLDKNKVEITRQFNARLADAGRLPLTPQLPPLDTTKKNMTYQVVNRPIDVLYPAPKITPKTLRNEPQDPIFPGFVKVGAGMPKAILLEGGYHGKGSDNLDFGVDFKHLSMNNSSALENQQFADSDLGISATVHSPSGFSVASRINYSHDILHFYGYSPLAEESEKTISFASDDVKQRFSLLSGQVKLYSNQKTKGDINYQASADFYNLQDLYAAKEKGLAFNVNASKWFSELNPLSLALKADLSTLRDTTKQSLNIVTANPSYTFHSDKFRVKAGLNFAASGAAVTVFPDLEASANIVENFITAFVATEGTVQKNTFRSLSTVNPFLARFPELRNSSYYHYYGGIKGEYRGIQYRAQLGYKDVKNLALFLTNTDSIPRMDALYDTASIFTFSAELKTRFDGLELAGRFSQHVYTLENQEKPWHLPSLTLNASAAYTGLIENLTLKSELFMQNGVPVRDISGNTKNLNALLDLSFSGNYQLSENIAAFVQINNVLNNRWQRWQYYPTYGLNVLAGLQARF